MSKNQSCVNTCEHYEERSRHGARAHHREGSDVCKQSQQVPQLPQLGHLLVLGRPACTPLTRGLHSLGGASATHAPSLRRPNK